MDHLRNKTLIIPESAFVAEGAVIKGEVRLGEEVSVWFHTTIRADDASLEIGAGTNVQDNCVIHVDNGLKMSIGNGVTIGHGAIVHGCNIGENSLIGMGAIILNEAEIGKNCIVGAGTLITQKCIIPDNSLVLGNPGKIKRTVTEEELENIKQNSRYYIEEAKKYREDQKYI